MSRLKDKFQIKKQIYVISLRKIYKHIMFIFYFWIVKHLTHIFIKL